MPHFRPEFQPSSSAEIQSEYLFPRTHAIEALEAVRAIGHLITPALLTSELRSVAADEFWMSPAYGTDVVGIHLTWKQDPAALAAVLPRIEEALAPFGTRPHWGKVSTADRTYLARGYERLDDFAALAAKWDPAGKFGNSFLRRILA